MMTWNENTKNKQSYISTKLLKVQNKNKMLQQLQHLKNDETLLKLEKAKKILLFLLY